MTLDGLLTVGNSHTIGASAALLLGAFQLVRTRRDQLHRRVGYGFMAAMVATNVTALGLYKFTGGINIFHVFAVFSLFTIAMAVKPFFTRPRPVEWKLTHYYWVSWSYAGLSAAAATEFLVRVLAVEGWLSSVLGSMPVILFAAWIIPRLAPPPRRPRAVQTS